MFSLAFESLTEWTNILSYLLWGNPRKNLFIDVMVPIKGLLKSSHFRVINVQVQNINGVIDNSELQVCLNSLRNLTFGNCKLEKKKLHLMRLERGEGGQFPF